MIPRDRDEERQFYRIAHNEGLRDGQAGRPKATSALDWHGYLNGYDQGCRQQRLSAGKLAANPRRPV